jgi:hypothetical protein
MSWASKMFGETLLVKSDTKPVGEAKPTEEVLSGKKFVVLYFSARAYSLHFLPSLLFHLSHQCACLEHMHFPLRQTGVALAASSRLSCPLRTRT